MNDQNTPVEPVVKPTPVAPTEPQSPAPTA